MCRSKFIGHIRRMTLIDVTLNVTVVEQCVMRLRIAKTYIFLELPS